MNDNKHTYLYQFCNSTQFLIIFINEIDYNRIVLHIEFV